MSNLEKQGYIQSLDIRNKYIRDVYELHPHRTLYFTRHHAYNIHPSKCQLTDDFSQSPSTKDQACYIYVIEGLGDIYAHPYQIYPHFAQLGTDPLTNPCQKTVQYFQNLYLLYQQMEGADRSEFIIQKILEPGPSNKQVIENHLNIEGKLRDAADYREQNQLVVREYNRKHRLRPLKQEQFVEKLEKRLLAIPIQHGEDRLQPIIKFGRQLVSMYGMEVLGNKDWQRGKRILIKCDLIELRDYPEQFYSSLGLNKPTPEEDSQAFLNLNLSSLIGNFKQSFRSSQSEQEFEEDAQEYNRLKIKFLKQVVEQLLEYQFLTNSHYPNLHPDYICFNTMSDHFTLAPLPIIVQGLGYHLDYSSDASIRDQCYYDRNFIRDIGWSCQTHKPFSSFWNIVLLMHYFQMGKFQLGVHLTQQTPNPKEWLKLLFGMSDKQIDYKLNELKNELAEKEENIKQQQCLLSQQSYARTILLLLLATPQLKPSLSSLCQIFPLNHRISSLSPSRHEHLLYLRLRIVKLAHGNHVNFLWDMNKCFQDTNTEHVILEKQNRIYLYVLTVALFLVGMELRELFRIGDEMIRRETQQMLDNILNDVDQIVELFRSLFALSNFYGYLVVVVKKLAHIYKESKKSGGKERELTMLYSKMLKKIMVWMLKQEMGNKNGKLYDKCYKNKGKNNLQQIRGITRLAVSLVLRMQNSNLHWCEYYVYRKIKKLMESEQISQTEIIYLQSQLENKSSARDSEWMVWGRLWPEDDNDSDVCY